MATAGSFRPFSRLGLSLRLREGWRSALVAGAAGLGFGLFMVLADATVFHAAVPEVQRQIAQQWTLGERLGRFLTGAASDELVLRLGGLTALLGLAAAAGWPRSTRLDVLAALVTAAVLWPIVAWSYLANLDWSALTVLRELSLHVGAGWLWGWLYCRHGWLAGLIGHSCAHLVLQPLIGLSV